MLSWLVDNWTEVLGFTTGLACVALAARRNVWTFPIGVANNVVFLVLFWGAALYAEAGLQVLYLGLGVLGWVAWVRARGRPSEPFVRHTPRRALVPLLLGGVLGSAALAWLLHAATDSTSELADGATTAFSVVAQIMLNARWLQTWYVWIAVDVALVALFASKQLYLTAGLYLVFIALCAHGLRSWRAEMRQRADAPAEPVAA